MFDSKYKEACENMKLSDSFKTGLVKMMKQESKKAVPKRRLVLATIAAVILVSTSVVFATNYATNGELIKSILSGFGYDAQQTKGDALETDATAAPSATPTAIPTAIPTAAPTATPAETTAASTQTATTAPKETTKATTVPTGRIAPSVSASAGTNSVTVKWNKISSPDLVGYKVVASKSDSTPKYSENGYYSWITDANTTSCTIKNGDGYNSGDVGKFSGGTAYYFSVTAVYGDEWQKIAGNAVQVTMPGTPLTAATCPAVNVNASPGTGGVSVSWSKTTDATGFVYYKVVASVGNSAPSYPDDGYVTYITDPNVTSYFVANDAAYYGGDFGGKFAAGTAYYFSITACYDRDVRSPGNAVPVTMP